MYFNMGSESVSQCNRLIFDPLEIRTVILITVYSHAEKMASPLHANGQKEATFSDVV